MLAYAVYMMILSDYIPPFADDQRPAIGEANRKCWHLQLKPGLVWVDRANNNLKVKINYDSYDPLVYICGWLFLSPTNHRKVYAKTR